jgi:hypothetical protein
MRSGDDVYVVGMNGSSIEKGKFTGKVVKLLSMKKIEIKIGSLAKLVDVGFCLPATEETTKLVRARKAALKQSQAAADAAQTALEKLWFLRVSPTSLVEDKK